MAVSGPGFTLVELLAASAVLAVLLSLVYGAATGAFRIASETEAQCEIYAMAGIAVGRILEDLESTWSSPPGDGTMKTPFYGETRDLGGRPAGFLLFRTLSHLDFTPGGGLATEGEVQYDVIESDNGEGLVLYRTDRPVYGGIPQAGSPRWPLCEGLSGVRFLFRDASGKEWDHWDSSQEEFGGRLPAMVAIELEFRNPAAPDAPYRFRSGTVLPVAALVDGNTAESK